MQSDRGNRGSDRGVRHVFAGKGIEVIGLLDGVMLSPMLVKMAFMVGGRFL